MAVAAVSIDISRSPDDVFWYSLAAATAAGAMAAPPRAAMAASSEEAVEAWINRSAIRLPRTDAGGPIDDLDPLRGLVADARVAGLGESAHGTHEQFTLKHRAARLLTERAGFRTLAWEENWGSGVAIDRYVARRHHQLNFCSRQ